MSKGDNCNAVVHDTAEPLDQVRDANANGQSIVSAILDIQKHAITRSNWIKSLECLYLATDRNRDGEPLGKRQRLANGDRISSFYTPELLRRTYLDPVSDTERGREYVAVSYTWDLSDEEHRDTSCHSFGSYFIESRKTGEPAHPSHVRDVVWERALSYAHQSKCDFIWLDRECVDQENAKEKEVAIQNMHLVYSLSRHPIALLTHVIETTEELDLLASLLTGDIRAEEKPALLDLVRVITSDLWWQRAWTFQEDYRASTRMNLLIPHTFNVESHKQSILDLTTGRPLLGKLPLEVSIKSADFRRCATEFCLRYVQEQPEAESVCRSIIRTAGKYNVLLRQEALSTSYPMITRSMTPTILADMDRRKISMQSDRLAIVANCCDYATRLDTPSLKRYRCSLSLSILALYLMNGELIDNHPRRRRGTLGDNVYTYLAKQSLDSFRPPMKELTFIKSCRLLDPVLTPAGTQTWGHLWRLGKVIRPQPLKRNKYRTLSPLATLATDLQYRKYGRAYTDLAVILQTWAQELASANRTGSHRSHGGRSLLARPRPSGWVNWMADEVEAALLDGRALRLASLVDLEQPDEYSPYTAVFVGDSPDDWSDDDAEIYAFTSVRPSKQQPWPLGDISKHVSLEVEVEWPGEEDDDSTEVWSPQMSFEEKAREPRGHSEAEDDFPKLYIRRWLNGLCSWNGSSRQPFLFPWPEDLLATTTTTTTTTTAAPITLATSASTASPVSPASTTMAAKATTTTTAKTAPTAPTTAAATAPDPTQS